MSAPRITAANFKRLERNTLMGFCDLTLPDIGLVIHECPVHRMGEARWVAMPGKPILDKVTKQAQIDPQTRRPRYGNVIDWTDASSRRAFQEAAVEAVRALLGGGRKKPDPAPQTKPAPKPMAKAEPFFSDEIPF